MARGHCQGDDFHVDSPKAVRGMLRWADGLPFTSCATSGPRPPEEPEPFKGSSEKRNVFVKPVELALRFRRKILEDVVLIIQVIGDRISAHGDSLLFAVAFRSVQVLVGEWMPPRCDLIRFIAARARFERSKDGEDERVFVSCRPTHQHCFFHSFPQPIRVTNNLDREFWKVQSCRMHEGPTNNFITGDKFEAKSLFQNILAISPCGSRFCPDPAISRARKFLGIRILGKVTKKNIETYIRHESHLDRTRAGLRRADNRGWLSPHLPSIPVYLSTG
jgi:hypothetical protein